MTLAKYNDVFITKVQLISYRLKRSYALEVNDIMLMAYVGF